MKTILILTANPEGTPPVRLGEEVREIDEGLRRARHREQFNLQQRWAVRPIDVQRALLDYDPQIVHFAGHGEGDAGIILEDEKGAPKYISAEALSDLFALFPGVECVVLNACYSEPQANAIAQHIDHVIGMSQAIGDQAAIKFAVGFYDALGAGRTYEFAYKLGCSAIQLDGTPGHLTPVLKTKP